VSDGWEEVLWISWSGKHSEMPNGGGNPTVLPGNHREDFQRVATVGSVSPYMVLKHLRLNLGLENAIEYSVF